MVDVSSTWGSGVSLAGRGNLQGAQERGSAMAAADGIGVGHRDQMQMTGPARPTTYP